MSSLEFLKVCSVNFFYKLRGIKFVEDLIPHMSQLFQFTSTPSKSRRTVKELQFRDQGEPELVGRCSVVASQRAREHSRAHEHGRELQIIIAGHAKPMVNGVITGEGHGAPIFLIVLTAQLLVPDRR